MDGLTGPPLRYRPYEQRYVPDLAAPMQAHRQHMLDQQAKEHADALMAQRDQELQSNMQHQRTQEQNSEVHNNRRDALYEKQEQRRENAMVLDRKRVTDAEHEQLIHQLFYGATSEEQAYAAAALQRAGYQMPEPLYDDPSPIPGQPSPKLQAPEKSLMPDAPMDAKTLGGTLLPPGDHTSMRPKMLPGDAVLSRQMGQADKKYSQGLGSGMPYQAAMEEAKKLGARGVEQVGPDQWRPIDSGEYKTAMGEADAIGSLGVEQTAPDRWAPIDPSNQGEAGSPPPKFLPGMAPR